MTDVRRVLAVEPRICATCGGEYMPRKSESIPRFLKRRACSLACRKRRGWPPERQRERFFERIVPEPNSGCWLWYGSYNEYGYGRTTIDGHKYAHVASWEYHNGPVPIGLHVLHKCDVAPCVNPDHLFLGTFQDNMRDMVAKGRNSDRRGELCPTARLTESDIQQIRASKETQETLAERYGVARGHISQIQTRRRWSHI